MLGIKQEAFANNMGEDWNQKRVSLLEAKEVIDDKLLQQIAELLKVPAEAIKNFDEETAINVIATTITNNNASINGNYTINPIDKLMEVVEENKKLYEELLKVEREKIALLERMVDGSK